MNRHYKKRTVKPELIYIAYKDYAPWSNCTMIFGVFTKFDDALNEIKEDSRWRETIGYKKYSIKDYNKRRSDLGYITDDGCYVSGVSCRLGHRIGEVYEVNMNKSGDLSDQKDRIRYVIFQTYMNQAV